jgi:tetratricopeptide (TPR) repeat protein/CHAT domain-containing protein
MRKSLEKGRCGGGRWREVKWWGVLLGVLLATMGGVAEADKGPKGLEKGVFERLRERLEAIPKRWETLPAPLVPVSGKTAEQVLGAASKTQEQAALHLRERLLRAPLSERAALLEEARRSRPLIEVDLWLPLEAVQSLQMRSLEQAALVAEVWLELAERSGRRDVLLMAGGVSLYLTKRSLALAQLGVITTSWAALPHDTTGRRGAAQIAGEQAEALFRLGNNSGALSAYRKARELYQGIGFRLGEGNMQKGEAEVLSRLGDNPGALSAYRKARELYLAEGDRLGEGNTWQGEATVLFRLGDNPGTLSAYRKARALLQAEGDRLDEGNTWRGEAEVLFHLGDNPGALSAYHKARELFLAEGDRLGEGNTWQGEAGVLSLLGDNPGALSAYRKAHELFQAAGDGLGEGNTWQGEAAVLFHLGDNAGALSAYRKARELYQAMASRQGEGNTWQGEAVVLFRLGDNPGALSAHRKAREFYQTAGERSGEGHTWQGEAEVLFRLGDNPGALSACRKARELYQTVGDRQGEGNTWQGEAEVLFRRGDNAGALSAHRKARALAQAVGDRQGEGHTWRGEAEVLFRLGDNPGALSAYRRAREFFQTVEYRPGEGDTWKGEAEVLFRLGNHPGALSAHRKARELFQTTGERQGEGNTWRGEAEVVFRLGDIPGALSAYRKARELFQAVGYRLGEGQTWQGEAEVLFRLGDTSGALSAYRKARGLVEAVGYRLGEGHTWQGEAEVLLHLGDNPGALSAYRKARELFQAVGSRLGEGDTWKGEAEVLFRQGDNTKALSAHRKARELFQAVGSRLSEGNTWQGEAEVLLRLGDNPGAANAAARAAELGRTMSAIPTEINSRITRAHALLGLGRSEEAMKESYAAIALINEWRNKGVGDADRVALSNISAPYDLLVPLLARRGGAADVTEALRLAEAAHAPVLLDLLASGVRRPGDTGDLALKGERQRLGRDLARIGRRLSGTLPPSEVMALEAEHRDLERQLERNELGSLAAHGSRLLAREAIDAARTMELVNAVGPVLLYYVADSETVGFLLLPGEKTPRALRLPLSWGALGDEVRKLRDELGDPQGQKKDAEERARHFWDVLITPFAEALGGQARLVIVPHGPLHQLPFEALLDPAGRPLSERWVTSVAPSLSALWELRHREFERRRAPGNSPSFLALSSRGGFALPDREFEELSVLFGSNPAHSYQREASFDTYEKLAPTARQLFLATHGVQRQESRTGTYLEIQASETHEGRLSAGEIAALPLTAELVTLAACATARGEVLLSDERIDLGRAFLIAGASAVLTARWSVPEDEATRTFLLDFYRALRKGGPAGKGLRKDEALAEARRKARESGAPAQRWAAWVLVGDGS